MSGIAEYGKLEQRLVLLSWLNDHFGYQSNRDLLADMKETAEGFDASGRSYVFRRLESRGDKVKIPPTDLVRYDDHIRQHLQRMNARRSRSITLRYFQHLAALYTELFLDKYFHHREEMLRLLNGFVDERNAAKPAGVPQDTKFSQPDLEKLAFWMATGSGKTLILHLNYRQFLHYNSRPLDNILLITPNQGLSDQHLAELAASDIPAKRFDLNESGLMIDGRDAVRVIEITKLVEQKRGGGVSVPVEAFEGYNLIFVDEGHKGAGGKAWRKFRDALAATGFTFEYSATFGQALTAARNDQLTAEYGKSIVFDYSYRYFHGDGYGKDFRVLNLREETTEDRTNMLLLGNLLSFYQQQRLFEDQTEFLRRYNLEKPLWVFVGGTVNAVYTKNGRQRSDVLTVARFLHHVLENRGDWVTGSIRKLTEGKTGLTMPDGRDVFEGKFKYLQETGKSPQETYEDLLARTLHAPGGGGLHLCTIRGSAGEIGLKASNAQDYFGLIYIGDTSKFKKLLEEDDSGMTLEEDSVSDSLFDDINESHTGINVLIGAKKFMEGWNSWRVSNMGLLNIGKKEGSQIIQLFGRGVRLRGRDFTLKRSQVLDGKHPRHLNLLETLNIFAVRANYMSQFRKYLESEGVEAEGSVELPFFVRPNTDFLGKGLLVPRVLKGHSFAASEHVVLEPDPSLRRVRVDMSLRVQTLESDDEGIVTAEAQSGDERSIPDESLDLVDWEQAYLDLLEHKQRKGLVNLVIRPDVPRKILGTTKSDNLYCLVAEESVVRPASFVDRDLLQEAAVNILRKYADTFYRVRRERWESNHMIYRTLDASDPNLSFNHLDEVKDSAVGHGGRYLVRVRRSENELVRSIETLIDEAEKLYEQETTELPRISFDRHLYLPLLLEHADKLQSSPPGLNKGESQFVGDLKQYWAKESEQSLANVEVFLLRNLGPGIGVGFFEERGFYPDFILWIIAQQRQDILFVEPHGMLHAKAYQHDDKARLHEILPKLAKEIGARSNRRNVMLDSYIVSATPYEKLRKRYDDGSWDRAKFAEFHILFPECCGEYDYMAKMFKDRPR